MKIKLETLARALIHGARVGTIVALDNLNDQSVREVFCSALRKLIADTSLNMPPERQIRAIGLLYDAVGQIHDEMRGK